MRRHVLLAAACACLIPAAPAGAEPPPYSAHSMVNSCCTPYAQKSRMFAEAKAMGAAYIRLDVVLDAIFDAGAAPVTAPNWQGVDEVTELSRRHRLPVLAVMRATPAHISTCMERRPEGHHRCAAADPGLFGAYVRRVIERAPDVFRAIEVWNEPDGSWAFDGTPAQYAQMLSATYGAVKPRFPGVRVLIGGAMNLDGRDWYERMFAASAAGTAPSFDVANVHVRGRLATLAPTVRAWRGFFRRHGHSGPLWVTETGYPSDDRFQRDERYRGGESGQARYLRDALPAMASAGAAQIFVTTRDTWVSEFGPDSPFASEGVVSMDQAEPYTVRRKPAFGVLRDLARTRRDTPLARAVRSTKHRAPGHLAAAYRRRNSGVTRAPSVPPHVTAAVARPGRLD